MPARRDTPAHFGLSYNHEEGMVSLSRKEGHSFSLDDLLNAWSYADTIIEEISEEMDFFREKEKDPRAYLLKVYDQNRHHSEADEVKYQLLEHDKVE